MFDSAHGKQGSVDSVLVFGGDEGDVCEFDVNTVVWGDVRIDFYVHQSRSSKRAKLFFLVFNTQFYPDKYQINFPKFKLDMLSKDRHHIKCDHNFAVGLHFVPDKNSNAEQIKAEGDMRGLFLRHGTRRRLARGDTLSWPASHGCGGDEKLVLVTGGHLEGVVEEADGQAVLDHHPLGREVDGRWATGGGGVRRPNVLVAGRDAVLGASAFLSGAHCVEFRAGDNVEVYELMRSRDPMKEDSPDFRQLRDTAGSAKGLGRKVYDTETLCKIEGMTARNMATFYRGLAVNISTQLSRTRVEAIRISECKAFNDRQTVLKDQDETEHIRVSCIKTFSMSMTEKVLLIIKCSVKSAAITRRNCRLIVLSNYLVLDPEYYGPEIGTTSHKVDVGKLRAVNPADDSVCDHGLIVTVLGQRVQGLDIIANVIKYQLTFHGNAETIQVYNQLSTLCRKAELLRERESFKPFETPVMTRVLERCATVHQIKKGDRLVQASTSDSLFLVRTGEVRLVTRGGEIFSLVREGHCFGETTFALQALSGYAAEANMNSIVLEIRQRELNDFILDDPMLGARFYYILCEVIETNLRETLEETYPGSWSQRDTEGQTAHLPNLPVPVLSRISSNIGRSLSYASSFSTEGSKSPVKGAMSPKDHQSVVEAFEDEETKSNRSGSTPGPAKSPAHGIYIGGKILPGSQEPYHKSRKAGAADKRWGGARIKVHSGSFDTAVAPIKAKFRAMIIAQRGRSAKDINAPQPEASESKSSSLQRMGFGWPGFTSSKNNKRKSASSMV